MWWAGDWMACSQSLRVSSCASERGLNNVEYTFGNKIIVTCLTDNNPVLITTHSSLPHIMKGVHCGDRGVSGFIWNRIWNRHCQVLLAPLHDEMEFLENVSVSQCLPILDNFDILSSSLVISFQYPALILLNNVFVIQIFCLILRVVLSPPTHGDVFSSLLLFQIFQITGTYKDLTEWNCLMEKEKNTVPIAWAKKISSTTV